MYSVFHRLAYQIPVLALACLLTGCETADTEPEASTNDIQAFLDQNPDAVESPEDIPADEDAVFDSEVQQ